MSDGIREASNAGRQALHSLQRRNKAELENSKRINEAQINEMKKSNDASMVRIRDEHQIEIAGEVQKKEETLEALRKNQEETQRLLEAETKRQAQLHDVKRTDMKAKGAAEIERVAQDHQLTIEELNARQNDQLRDMNEESRFKLNEMDQQQRERFAAEGNTWRNKVDTQRSQFHHRYTTETANFQRQEENLKKQNEVQTLKTHRDHEQKMTEMNKQHVVHSEKVTNHHQKSLVDKEQFFEKKYQTQLAQHASSNKILEDLNVKAINQLKDDVNKRQTVEMNHAKDPFFSFIDLKPQVEERPDAYVVKVKVPEYAKEEVSLTANFKEMVLSSNRRYQDVRKDENGTTNKVNKVESLVTKIPVGQVLDPRKMEKSWAEGVMTFVVKKA
jgi:HSP20 family molecular chaperone IbpA